MPEENRQKLAVSKVPDFSTKPVVRNGQKPQSSPVGPTRRLLNHFSNSSARKDLNTPFFALPEKLPRQRADRSHHQFALFAQYHPKRRTRRRGRLFRHTPFRKRAAAKIQRSGRAVFNVSSTACCSASPRTILFSASSKVSGPLVVQTRGTASRTASFTIWSYSVSLLAITYSLMAERRTKSTKP